LVNPRIKSQSLIDNENNYEDILVRARLALVYFSGQEVNFAKFWKLFTKTSGIKCKTCRFFLVRAGKAALAGLGDSN